MLMRCLDRARASSARALRRQFCKEKESAEVSGAPLGHHHVAKKEYGFMESADIIFQETTRSSLHHRWDWHAWQLLVALLPPFFIYKVAMYSRGEMSRLRVLHDEKVQAEEAARLEELHRSEKLQNVQNDEMKERLQQLEAQVAELTKQREQSAEHNGAHQSNAGNAEPPAGRSNSQS